MDDEIIIPPPQRPYSEWSTEELRQALTQAADGYPTWAWDLLAAGADPNGMPLIMAIQCGESGIVNQFIAAGVDVNRPQSGTTPLLRAVESYYPDIVRALIAAGADVQQRDAQGRAPLDRIGHGYLDAAPEDWAAMRQILLAAGA